MGEESLCVAVEAMDEHDTVNGNQQSAISNVGERVDHGNELEIYHLIVGNGRSALG